MSDALEAQDEMDFVQDPYHDAINLERQLEYEFWGNYGDYDYIYSIHSDKIVQIEKLKEEADRRYEKYRDTSRELHPSLLYDATVLEIFFDSLNLMASQKTVWDDRRFFAGGAFSRHKYPCTPYPLNLSNKFKEEISILINRWFSLKSKSDSETWLKDFLNSLREERQTGHMLALQEDQKTIADKYYKANLYFIKLISISDATALDARAMLEDDILKPIETLRNKYPEFY